MSTSRREFLQASAATAGWFALSACAGSGGAGEAAGGGAGVDFAAKRRLGRTDLWVSPVGFGGAEIGYGEVPQDQVDRLLNRALDLGLDAIDTAECYRESEELIGKAVAHRRDEYLLFSKVGHWPTRDGWSAASIESTIERSLQRLRTDRLDLVHLHSCSQAVLERGEAIEALERAKSAGKVRYIGYSGDSAAAAYALSTKRFDTLMTSVNFADQEAIELLLPACREQGLGVVIKRALANAVWRYDDLPGNEYHQEYWRRMRALDFDFTRPERRGDAGPTGPASIALRFALSLPGVHTAVIGTTNPERFAENQALLGAGPLPEDQIAAIRQRWSEIAPPAWVGQI
jgi:aryl-alcohol dehydrogenase-like predicted oxidoreductase